MLFVEQKIESTSVLGDIHEQALFFRNSLMLLLIPSTTFATEQTLNQADTIDFDFNSLGTAHDHARIGFVLRRTGEHENILSVLMHCLLITCVTSIIWLVGGYSLAFGDAKFLYWRMEKDF